MTANVSNPALQPTATRAYARVSAAELYRSATIMKTLSVILFFLTTMVGYADPTGDQFPYSCADLLKGCKLFLEMEAHDHKKDGDDKHTMDEGFQAIGTFNYIRGFVQGIRTLQCTKGIPRTVNFPEEGVDCVTLIQPLVKFLEKNPKQMDEHSSIGLYMFLTAKYPVKSK